MVLESTWIDRVANSTPIVDLESRLNSFRVNRLSRLDFPTPESPIRTTTQQQGQSAGKVAWRAAGVGRRSGQREGTFEEELQARLANTLQLRTARAESQTATGQRWQRRVVRMWCWWRGRVEGLGRAHIVFVVSHDGQLVFRRSQIRRRVVDGKGGEGSALSWVLAESSIRGAGGNAGRV